MYWLIATAVAAPVVSQEVITDGPVRKRLSDSTADIVLFYGGEQHGDTGPCGCEERPKGGLDRTNAYVTKAEQAAGDVPALLVNAGDWTDGQAIDFANAPMFEALNAGGWDVLNVGWRDIDWVTDRAFPEPVVSANLRAPGIARFRVVQGVAVTGVTGAGPLDRAAGKLNDPLQSLREVLPQMAAQADVIVVLGYDLGPVATEVSRLDGVDVFVEANEYGNTYDPVVVGDTVWVKSRFETRRLGELRLMVQGGVVTSALDRHIDLDKAVR